MGLSKLTTSAIKHEVDLFTYQMIAIAILALASVGVFVIESTFPSFFNYPYFKWGGWEAVLRFWPLFAWGATLTVIAMIAGSRKLRMKRSHNRELWVWELITSTLAGAWEELGYRFVYVCYAMLGVAVVNWLLGAGLGLILVAICFIGAVVAWSNGERGVAIVFIILTTIALLFALYADPVYWFYQFLVWVIYYTTFTMMGPVLYGEHEMLLVFGAVVANSWFRDGHKYQGIFGLVNAWYAGMVLLYATLTYGLITAIVVHIIYDIIVSTLRFILQKTH